MEKRSSLCLTNHKAQATGDKINILRRKGPRFAQRQKLGDTLRTVWSYTVVAVVEAVVGRRGPKMRASPHA